MKSTNDKQNEYKRMCPTSEGVKRSNDIKEKDMQTDKEPKVFENTHTDKLSE